MAVDLAQIIPPLVRAKVDFILIGGMAAILHGSARVTFDVDLVYSRSEENIRRLADALAPQEPYLRDAPVGLPFEWDAKTIDSGLNFMLATNLGDVDLFGELAGGDTYQDLLPHSVEVEAFGVRFKCIDLPTLICIKEAAGGSKDREAIAELRVLLEERQKKEARRATVFSARQPCSRAC
jgi:predicted nucleotidyltransferase